MSFEYTTDVEWAYLAGIIDGEGCMSIHDQKRARGDKVYTYHTLFLSVGNTSHALLKWINDRFGGSICPQKRPENHRDTWQWHVASKQAEEIIRKILPYLVVKKDQAELSLRFRDSFKGLKPCLYNPLPVEVSEFRGKCKSELSALKRQRVLEEV